MRYSGYIWYQNCLLNFSADFIDKENPFVCVNEEVWDDTDEVEFWYQVGKKYYKTVDDFKKDICIKV
jgi:hypothetical protein